MRYFLILLKRKIFRKRYLVILIFLAAFYFYGGLFRVPDGKLHVRFLNVGQGDATLVTTAKGSKILIDGGPSDKVLGLINHYVSLGDRSLDLMLLTHPHADHLTGLITVLKNFDVKNIIYNPVNLESRVYLDFVKGVLDEEKQGAKIFAVKTGDLITVGDISIKILWAPVSPDPNDLNNDSLISLISYGSFDVFMPGDAQGSEADSMILGMATPSAVEVLKAAHHGSKNGLSRDFIKVLSPMLTVIPVGKNSYGHPDSALLGFLDSLKSRVLRTDLDGTIDVVSDGASWGIADRKLFGAF